MDLIGIFTTAIGKFNCSSNLDLANKIFDDNKFNFIENENFPSYRTTIIHARPYKGLIQPFVNLEDEIKLKEIILKNAEIYVESLGYEVNKNYKLKVINLWLNEMTSGSQHKPHNHYGYLFSGCFYVEIPKNSGSLSFSKEENDGTKCLDIKNRNGLNSDSFSIDLNNGDMIIWKSNLLHGVPFAEFEGVRKSFAFDIVVE